MNLKKLFLSAGILFLMPATVFGKDVLSPDGINKSPETGFWAQSLYGKVDRETEAAQRGFHSETRGVTVGADTRLSDFVTMGAGYTYADTSVHISDNSFAKLNNNTVFAYGRYQPNDFFLDGIVGYGFGNLTKTSAAGVGSKFDTRLTVAQLLSGVSYENSAPLWGFRYVGYQADGVQKLSADVFTGLIKMQAGKTFSVTENISVRPDFSWAFTYDFVSDPQAVVVLLPNGAGYAVDGKRMERLGAEMTLRLTLKAFEKAELSAGYTGAFKSDFVNHSLMLRAQICF